MARDLPAGVVTLLFTDVEGSTRLLHGLGDEYGEALREHRRRLRAAFADHEGVEVDTQGDAFFIGFARATDVVRRPGVGARSDRPAAGGSRLPPAHARRAGRGAGKTRLALEAAARRIERYPHGVHFVPLVSVASPEFLAPAVAESIQFAV